MSTLKTPNLLDYDSVDYGFEVMHDFFLRWTFRWSPEELKSVNPKVQEMSRRIVCALIYGHFDESDKNYKMDHPLDDKFRVSRVNVSRQENRIDLLVEVHYIIQNEEQKAVLNIENKWYTPIIEGQLEKYSGYVKNKYTDGWIIRNIIIFPDHEKITNDVILHCKGQEYEICTIGNIRDAAANGFEVTGNYLFDEFWFEAY